MQSKSSALKSRERYYWLKEHHICVCCGHIDAEPNNTLCFECANKKRKNILNTIKKITIDVRLLREKHIERDIASEKKKEFV